MPELSDDPGSYTVEELKDEIESIDSPNRIAAALSAEADGENRETAKEAFRSRLVELTTEETNDGGTDTDSESGTDSPDLLDIRSTVETTAGDVIGRDLDGVVAVGRDGEDGWRAEVEVVERAAVPNTQDILGRYELLLDAVGNVREYSRMGRYRRSDVTARE